MSFASRIVVRLLVIGLSVGVLAACGPSAPPGCPYEGQIRSAWAGTGDEAWAVQVAWRESRCQPGARNRSGASGLFQLMMPLHARLVTDVCGSPAVFDADCNIAAARVLYEGSGRAPWRL